MMPTNFPLIILYIFITISPTTQSTNTSFTECTPDCDTHYLPYPFGFSPGCKIPLNCSNTGDIIIGEYHVQNITSDHILIDLPTNCSRPMDSIQKLMGPNYALTRRNGFLLQNCTSRFNWSVSPVVGLVEDRLNLDGCESLRENGSFYMGEYGGDEFMTYDNLTRTNCTMVLTSVSIELSNITARNSSVGSLEFQTIELGWWVVGGCPNKCDRNASCTELKVPGGEVGFRCTCNRGFAGNGFADGGGCRRVPNCNASRYMSGHCGGTTRVGVLIGGIIAGAFLMAIVALVCYFIRRPITLKDRMSAKRLLCEAAGNSSVPFFPYKEIDKATNGFSEKQRMGTGAYGTVYAGKLHHNDWVAIKKIRHRDTNSIDQVMNEVKLLSSVSHPNLVRLLGCCIENGEQILVYEFMSNGTLSQHLQRERGKGLPWTIRLTIATETAHAIAHLHSAMNPPIYHRDIKSSNILLDYNFNSKVADFGLSRLGMTDDSHISTAPQGTPGYVDPQYHQNFHLSDKSDVYSFGVVLVEIITALKVVDFSRPHSEINLASLAIDRIGKARLDEIIDPFLEPNRDAWTLSSIHKMAELAFRCLAFHRDMRPSMMEVAEELEQIRLSVCAPAEDNICMASSVASSCSSPYASSEKSVAGTTTKKAGVGSRRLIVPQRLADSSPCTTTEEVKDSSPVSVQDPWLSEQNSPSTNSLLGNVVQ